MNMEYNKFVDTLKKSQLVDHLTENEIADAINEMSQRKIPPNYMLHFLPNLVYKFDSEYWWDPTVKESYSKLIMDLCNISQKRFKPIDLEIKIQNEDSIVDGDKFSFSFKLGQQYFCHELAFWGDAVDLSFISMINQSLKKSKIDGQFYWLNTNDQNVAVIYLSKRQYNKLKRLFKPDLRKFNDIFKF